jgi:hypothetical protein
MVPSKESMLSTTTLQRYGLRIYEDQLVAPLYDNERSLVRLIILDPASIAAMKLPAAFGLNIITARNSEVVLVDSIWDALCVYQTTGKMALVLPQGKVSTRVRRHSARQPSF